MVAVLKRANRFEISIAAIAIAGYLLILPVGLATLCSVPKAPKPSAYVFSIIGQSGESYISKTQKGPIEVKGRMDARGTAHQKDAAAEQSESWAGKFWCEINASDWFIGLFTLFLAIATYFLWRETERLAGGADDQADKMERSVAEAARAAAAMEGVAVAMAQNVTNAAAILANQKNIAERQLRAYVSVVVGAAVFQERGKGLRFEGRPLIVNDGMTPAYKLRHAFKAAIVKFPVPENFDFAMAEKDYRGGTSIGPRQNREIGAVVEDYVPDQDVSGIKDLSANKCLFVWGTVSYEDAFGQPHHANCAQILTWRKDDSVFGVYEPRHNDSD